MKRLVPLVLSAIAVLTLPLAAHRSPHDAHHLQIVEASVEALHHALESHRVTSEELVQMYLDRIAAYDTAGPKLNSFIHVNDQALDVARQRDRDRRHGRAHGDLFGVPIILKDNIDTADMPTTAGSVTLDGSVPPDDAFITERLRAAGAIVLGKGTLTEFANFLTNGMPAGYSSLGGFGFNPFDPRVDPRTTAPFNDGRPVLSPGGSSSGPAIAVSASLAAVGIGTETSGSILSPGTQNLLVGIKPTVGLVSRDGIIPITADQDTAGPLARTVTDAAIMLGAIAGFDPQDPATAACLTRGRCFHDYTRFLDKHALRHARIAVPRVPYWDGGFGSGGLSPTQLQVMNDAVAVLRAHGATVDIPVEVPTQADLSAFGTCVSFPVPADCSTVLLFGFKRDLNSYLASLGPGAPVHTLTDIIAVNNTTPGALKYGQTIAEAADQLDTTPGSPDDVRYHADRAEDLLLAKGGLDAIYNGPDGVPGTWDDYDAVLFPANRGANIAARAGYPSIVVPGGFVDNSNPAFPPGFVAAPAPFGVTFSGRAFSEPTLIGLAYAFEQATRHRVAPPTTPPLP